MTAVTLREKPAHQLAERSGFHLPKDPTESERYALAAWLSEHGARVLHVCEDGVLAKWWFREDDETQTAEIEFIGLGSFVVDAGEGYFWVYRDSVLDDYEVIREGDKPDEWQHCGKGPCCLRDGHEGECSRG
jgi:hypothetical protein